MTPQQLKKQFWKELILVLINKIPYIVLGWFFYPFINKSKVRSKINSSKYNDYTLGLWYMINDDELTKYDVDYDVSKVGRAKTKLGHFIKSYLFNAIRNPAYNYSLTFNPIDPKGNYDVVEVVSNTLKKKGIKINTLSWARWVWVNKFGKLDNKGIHISYDSSIIGKGEFWFNPNNRKDLLYCRKSYAVSYEVLFWTVYESFKIGAFAAKYDIIYKEQFVFRDWNIFKGLKIWKLNVS